MFHGGPLYFKILMDKLVTHVKSVAQALINSIKNFKICDLKGEDISLAITRFRDAQDRLHAVLMLPHDLEQIFVAVYQTSTVAAFNDMFADEARQLRRGMIDDTQPVFHQVRVHLDVSTLQQLTIDAKCERLHKLAGTLYTDMLYNKEWLFTPPKATALLTDG